MQIIYIYLSILLGGWGAGGVTAIISWSRVESSVAIKPKLFATAHLLSRYTTLHPVQLHISIRVFGIGSGSKYSSGRSI